MTSEYRVPRPQRMRLSLVPPLPNQGSSNGPEISAHIIKFASPPNLYGGSSQSSEHALDSSDMKSGSARETKQAKDLIAFANEGQRARAEILAERLELAIDCLIDSRLQDVQDYETAKRDLLFELYEREILTRDQVRRRGNLDPSDFYEELHAYRLRQAGG